MTTKTVNREMTWTAYVSTNLVPAWEALGWRRDDGVLQGCIHAEFGCYMIWDGVDQPPMGPKE